jgi:hypothetical protein
VNLRRLTGQAKRMIDKRGGMKALQADATELKDVVTSDESLADKAKDATSAIKDPGAPGNDRRPPAE